MDFFLVWLASIMAILIFFKFCNLGSDEEDERNI